MHHQTLWTGNSSERTLRRSLFFVLCTVSSPTEPNDLAWNGTRAPRLPLGTASRANESSNDSVWREINDGGFLFSSFVDFLSVSKNCVLLTLLKCYQVIMCHFHRHDTSPFWPVCSLLLNAPPVQLRPHSEFDRRFRVKWVHVRVLVLVPIPIGIQIIIWFIKRL